MAEAQKNTTRADATAEAPTPTAAAAPVAASPATRPGVLATVAISVGSVVAALALFGGGVAFGATVPNPGDHPHAPSQEAGPGPMGQDRMGHGGQQQGQDRMGQDRMGQDGPQGQFRNGQGETRAPGQVPPGSMGGDGPMQNRNGDTQQEQGQTQSGN